MKLLKEDIKFPDSELSHKLRGFLKLDKVQEAFKDSDIQKVFDMYTRYKGYEAEDNSITKLFFNWDINPLPYLINIPYFAFYNIHLKELKYHLKIQ